jgi:dTDP-4-dehydrorhamnose reductase
VIHISTDYVFSGEEHIPCRETDPVAPRTIYGITKYEGEKRLLASCPEAVILRTAWLYSSFGNNFVKTMMRLGKERKELGVVFDQIGTPTYAADLAWAIFTVIEASVWHPGIYHFTNEGTASWYDFAVAVKNLLAPESNCEIISCATEDYPTRAERPKYSVLSKQKIKEKFGIKIRHWQDSLAVCANKIKNKEKIYEV